MKHVELNGVWYDLAESAEGDHYLYSEQPLRPPNASVVQGDQTDFQMRPDLLLWRLTDWSEGEGQLKFDPSQPGRSYLLHNIDPFSRPGMASIGYRVQKVQDGGGDFNAAGFSIGQALDRVYAIRHTGAAAAYEIDSNGDATVDAVPPGLVVPHTICGDSEYLWCVIGSSLYRFEGTTWSQWNNQFNASGTYAAAIDLDRYVYYLGQTSGQLYELDKTTQNTSTPETALYEFSPGSGPAGQSRLVAGDGRIYFFTYHGYTSTIHEVVPSSASGTGYGRVLTKIKGVKIESLWFDGGTLYFHGIDGEAASSEAPVGTIRSVYYLDPEGNYGSLGAVRSLSGPGGNGPAAVEFTQGLAGPATSGRSTRTAFLLPPTYEDEDYDAVAQGIFEVDGLTGGFAAVGLYPSTVLSRVQTQWGLEYFGGKYFTVSDDDDVIYYWNTQLADNDNAGFIVSPSHDFNVVEEKILERIELFSEPLVSGAAGIQIRYSIDGGVTWVDTEQGISGVGDDFDSIQISTDSSTVKFRDIRIRVQFISGGTAKSWLKNVDVYARVVQKIRVWDLLLDCTDDAAPQGYNGAKLIDNIKGISENTVIKLVDKYQSHNQEESGDEYDVTIDDFNVLLSQQGEGIIAIRLIEVVGDTAAGGGGD